MLTITVQGTLEDRLKQAADSAKTEPQAIAELVLDAHLPNLNQATLDLLSRWEIEEATADPLELARRQSEGEQFMQALADNRSAGEGPSARKLWP